MPYYITPPQLPEPRVSAKPSEPVVRPKRSYERPQLKAHGQVTSVTLAGSLPSGGGGGFPF